jgi:P4 family phage/plasmid primase-like protien
MKNNMVLSSQYKDLSEFLAKHSAKNNSGVVPTHTRIPNKDLNIYGGSYVIPKEELNAFYELYYDHIFVKKKKEYLTEKQLETGGPMAVDFDFRYNYSVEQRIHTSEHIQDMIILYLEELKNCFVFEENKPFNVFIFEKQNVNRLEDKSLTKDGIHMIIGIKIDYVMQLMIREKMIEKLSEIWELPLINNWESVLDEGISKGSTNWQLFGSRKPGNDAYELTQHFIIKYDKSDGEFMMNEIKVEDFNLKENFSQLSVQNDENPEFEIHSKILNIYNEKIKNKNKKTKRVTSKTKINRLIEVDEFDDETEEYVTLYEIKNKETLEKAVNLMLKKLKSNEYEIRETHEYTQVLPEMYYEPGSHLLNRQVAFALKRTDERLFLSWVQLRSKASDFSYDTIPELYNQWKKYFNTTKTGVTRRSIMYWAKQYNFEGYQKVKNSSIDFYIEESLNTQTEYDLAQVLKQMYKDKYVCVSYDKKGIWYVFKNHRWVVDKGMSLREAISKQMYELYSNKGDCLQNEHTHYDATDERAIFIKGRLKLIGEIKIKLKKTTDKNNIMREAMELFYDGDFIKNMDKNKYLLCFNNGVVDFKQKIFRDGYPEDYITKTTRIDYVPYDLTNKEIDEMSNEILEFMEKLFPVPELNRYMWDHFSSCLIGTNKNQTFNVYHGSGSNGKSIIADLMSETLGEYKGTVPITLVTEKRGLIGGTSDEVLKLKGVRYAVMQEPSKGVKLNEGIMKELTGGDPIQARGLYSESEIFEPQFNLVVCTNNLFDIDSNDDGTWRRIRTVPFLSKFIDDKEQHTDDTTYVFQKDKSLKDKLPKFAPIFASMLVKRAFQTEGIVEDCDVVMSASNNYRKGQDHIAAFMVENIEKTSNPKDRIKKSELTNEFKVWFQREQGTRKIPKAQELYDYMDKKYGQCHKTYGWQCVKIIYDKEDNDEMTDL